MAFAVGDRVVHRYHGRGRIVRLDRVQARDGDRDCYVVAMEQGLVVWVPIDGVSEASLRAPLSAETIARLADILRGVAKPLETVSKDRQEQIKGLLKDGSPEALCTLVRDLTAQSARRTLSPNETDALQRAYNIVAGEWELATDSRDAAAEIDALLREGASRSVEETAT